MIQGITRRSGPVLCQSLLGLLLSSTAFAQAVQLAPDGSYVGGTPQLAPDGSYVGGTPQLAPDGSYVGGTPQLAPDGRYIGTGDDEEAD